MTVVQMTNLAVKEKEIAIGIPIVLEVLFVERIIAKMDP